MRTDGDMVGDLASYIVGYLVKDMVGDMVGWRDKIGWLYHNDCRILVDGQLSHIQFDGGSVLHTEDALYPNG